MFVLLFLFLLDLILSKVSLKFLRAFDSHHRYLDHNVAYSTAINKYLTDLYTFNDYLRRISERCHDLTDMLMRWADNFKEMTDFQVLGEPRVSQPWQAAQKIGLG